MITFALATTILHVGKVQKRRECALKYVIFSLRRPERTPDISDLENGQAIIRYDHTYNIQVY